jgi:hypothetical protein
VVPFLDAGVAFASDGRPRFLHHVFHPEHLNLFAVGLVQANGSMWRLADYQAQLIANSIIADAHAPARAARFRAKLKPVADRSPFVASERHRLEVNYYDYRRALKRLSRGFGKVRRLRLRPAEAAPAPAEASTATPARGP